MSVLDQYRPTVLPALFYLAALPVFLLLPRRASLAPAFFIISSLVFVTIFDGPAWAIGVAAVAIMTFVGVEGVARIRPRSPARSRLFAALLVAMHAAYLGCFFLPVPEAYRVFVPRPADQAPVMVLFSGIGLTFFRLVSFAHDRVNGRIGSATLLDFLAYVLFFPQFRHGPIERFSALAPQLRTARAAWRLPELGQGLLRIALTFVALIAALAAIFGTAWLSGIQSRAPDLIAAVRSPTTLTLVDVMAIVHLPVLMLYAVEWFSAGVQLGVARAFGIRGSENFCQPWRAVNPVDCWRRWQTTLGAWINDYAFRPLARRTRNTYVALALSFVYCGVLHGPQLRCLVWGAYNGLTVAAAGWWLRRRAVPPAAAARNGAGRIARSILARVALFVWMSVGMTILLDPDGCGLPLLGRYAQQLVALFWIGN